MANARNFTRGFTPASNPERGNNIGAMKWAFIYVKRAKAKNSAISYLRVPRVWNGQCKQFHARLYPSSNPERGNNIGAMKWAFIYVIRAKAKKSVISYLRVPRVWNSQCKQLHARLYPCQQPRKGLKHNGQRNWRLFMLK